MNVAALLFAIAAVCFIVSLLPEQRVSWQTIGFVCLAVGLAVGAW